MFLPSLKRVASIAVLSAALLLFWSQSAIFADPAGVRIVGSRITASDHSNIVVIGDIKLPPEASRKLAELLIDLAVQKRASTDPVHRAEQDAIEHALVDPNASVTRRQNLIAELSRRSPIKGDVQSTKDAPTTDLVAADLIETVVQDIQRRAGDSQSGTLVDAAAAEDAYILGLIAELQYYDFKRALSHYDDAVRLQPKNPTYLISAAELKSKLGRYAEAEHDLLAIQAGSGVQYSLSTTQLIETLDDLALIYWATGRYDNGSQVFGQIFGILQALPSEKVRLARIKNDAALLYWKQGRPTDAIAALEESKASMEADQSPEAQLTLSDGLNIYASMKVEYGDFNGAESMYFRSLNLRIVNNGSNALDPQVADIWNNLALLYRYEGRYGEAEELNRKAAQLYRTVFGPRHPNVATSKLNEATLECRQDHFDIALSLAEQVLEMRRAIFRKDHPEIASALVVVGYLKRRTGAVSEAENSYTEALGIQANSLGKHHLDYATTLMSLGSLYLEANRLDLASDFLHESVEILGSLSLPNRSREKHARLLYAQALEQRGFPELSQQERQSAEAIVSPPSAYCVE